MTDLASGATTLGTYTPTQLYCGDADVVTESVTVLSGQNLAQYQVFAIVSGKAKAVDTTQTDARGIAVGIMAQAVDASSADQTGPAFTAGAFNHEALVWPAAWDTYAERQAAFARTPIHIGKVL